MTDTVTIDRTEYDRLCAAAETLSDLQAYDRAMAALAAGEEELIPAAIVDRILDGTSRLRAFRDWRGLSGADLARASGVNRVQILDIEAGRKTGSLATRRKLAEALGITIDDLG